MPFRRSLRRKYYKEVGLGIDFTARDVQAELKKKGHPWEIAKGFDRSAAVGEFVPLKSLKNKKDISFRLEKNGEIMQQGQSADMIFPFDILISHISRYFTLQTGDVVFTGTPAGVGPVQIGDVLTGYLEGRRLLDCEIK